MGNYNIGDSVGAVLGSKDGVVKFLGYGTYQGKEVPETAVGWVAEAAVVHNISNPKIELENGSIVWGCECWWGSEQQIREILEKADEIVEVNIDEYRKEIIDNESSQ